MSWMASAASGSGRVGAVGIAAAMATRASRTRALDRSLLATAAGREWRAQDRHQIADRTFRVFAANTLSPKYRAAVNEQFKAYPLRKKEEWMRDARRFSVAQDMIRNLKAARNDPQVKKLVDQHREVAKEFVHKWVRDMAIERSVSSAKMGEQIPDLKAEIDEILEGAPGSTHFAEISKKGREQLVKHLNTIYELVQRGEATSPLNLKETAEIQEELRQEILALLEEIGYNEQEVGVIVHIIQEEFAEFDKAKNIDWSDSTEWTQAGGRSISTFLCVIVAGILMAGWEEFQEYLSREERAVTLGLQKEASDFVETTEEEVSHMKVDLATMASTLERLHLDKSDLEIHKVIDSELHTIQSRLSQLRKKVIELENSISKISASNKEGYEREKHGITSELNKLRKMVIKRMNQLKDLSTKQVWEATKKDILVIASYLKKGGLRSNAQAQLDKLMKRFQKFTHSQPTAENLQALKRVEEKIRALAETDLTLDPKKIKKVTQRERSNLYRLVSKF